MKTLNREWIKDNYGYEIKTTFYDDFSIAEPFGLSAVKDTYNRAFAEWKTNTVYITELCMVLNWKIWEHYKTNDELAKLYNDLWYECRDWCYDNLKDADLDYFISTTD